MRTLAKLAPILICIALVSQLTGCILTDKEKERDEILEKLAAGGLSIEEQKVMKERVIALDAEIADLKKKYVDLGRDIGGGVGGLPGEATGGGLVALMWAVREWFLHKKKKEGTA